MPIRPCTKFSEEFFPGFQGNRHAQQHSTSWNNNMCKGELRDWSFVNVKHVDKSAMYEKTCPSWICVHIPRKRTSRQSRLRNCLGRKVLNTSPPAWIGFAFEDVWGVYWDNTTINHLFGWGRRRSIELTPINIRWTFECIRVFGEEQFFIDGDIQKCQPTRVEVVSGHHTWPERNERNNLTMW